MRTSLPAHVFNHRRWAKTFPLTPRLTEGEFRFVSAQAKLQRCNPDAILRFALQFYMIEMAEPMAGRKELTQAEAESKQALIRRLNT
jgi:hypothetical protein